MNILETSTNWAKAEVYSSKFFMLFGGAFIAFSIGCWQMGTTSMASAYILPAAIAGILLLTVGIGIFIANKARTTNFVTAHNNNAAEFVQSEIARTNKSLKEYKYIVFRIIPVIITVAATLIYFIEHPVLRASCITTIAMMVVILLVDSLANARLEKYRMELNTEA